MQKVSSPLRYPGGKACMFKLMSHLINDNKLMRCQYAEPYAGGCGLALSLLYEGFVSDIHINDIDPAIWSFWYSVLFEKDRFVDFIASTDVSVEEWGRQKEIYLEKNTDKPVELGFSAFFLNRTNRSGVIKGAGMIGGKEQLGNYKIDCRFNKEDLIRKIERVYSYRDRIHLYNLDAVEFMEGQFSEYTLFCIDPPYVKKGASLYTSFYSKNDHFFIAEKVKDLNYPWVVTYDDNPIIREAYQESPQYSFDVRYSLNKKVMGSEILITSKDLVMPLSAESSRIKLYDHLKECV